MGLKLEPMIATWYAHHEVPGSVTVFVMLPLIQKTCGCKLMHMPRNKCVCACTKIVPSGGTVLYLAPSNPVFLVELL